MKSYMYVLLIAAILAGGFLLFSGNGDGKTGNSVNPPVQPSGDIQNVVLSMKDYNYYPQVINAKVGQTVRVSLDSSVYGCFRYFTVPDFKISENLKTPSDYVEFTPTQKGEYRFACGMGMGFGKIIVE